MRTAARPGAVGRGSGGATSGIGTVADLRRLVGGENAPSASAIGLPSCSIRAVTVLIDRPARSIVGVHA